MGIFFKKSALLQLMTSACGFQVTVLNISTPPVIVRKPQSLISPAAKTARFPCEASGVPTPNVTFYKDGVRLKIHGTFYDILLVNGCVISVQKVLSGFQGYLRSEKSGKTPAKSAKFSILT